MTVKPLTRSDFNNIAQTMKKHDLKRIFEQFRNDKTIQCFLNGIEEIHLLATPTYNLFNNELSYSLPDNAVNVLNTLKKQLDDYTLQTYPELFPNQ